MGVFLDCARGPIRLCNRRQGVKREGEGAGTVTQKAERGHNLESLQRFQVISREKQETYSLLEEPEGTKSSPNNFSPERLTSKLSSAKLQNNASLLS